MALSKVTYTDEAVQSKRFFIGPKVTAAQVNAIQDEIIANAAAIAAQRTITAVSSSQKACAINGLNVVAGGTGLADATLAAPAVGSRTVIRIGTLASGSVVVTCAAGVTLNGTNNVATFDAVNDALELVYKAANTWEVVLNVGAVALSTAG